MKLHKVKSLSLLAAGVFWIVAFRSVAPAPAAGTRSSASLVDTTGKGIDPTTGFVIDDGIELMRANCTGCHSSKLITQYRATREVWLEKIRWMQATQNLWNLGESEPKILDYLARHYAPTAEYERRPPLKNIEWYRLTPSKSGE